MLEQVLIRKPQTVREMKQGCYSKSTDADKTIIPESWDLNELQRSFIESMVETKNK